MPIDSLKHQNVVHIINELTMYQSKDYESCHLPEPHLLLVGLETAAKNIVPIT